jgi:hypothetical protein
MRATKFERLVDEIKIHIAQFEAFYGRERIRVMMAQVCCWIQCNSLNMSNLRRLESFVLPVLFSLN